MFYFCASCGNPSEKEVPLRAFRLSHPQLLSLSLFNIFHHSTVPPEGSLEKDL
jgi:hypothetical protein